MSVLLDYGTIEVNLDLALHVQLVLAQVEHFECPLALEHPRNVRHAVLQCHRFSIVE
jgi:hypothetical protein